MPRKTTITIGEITGIHGIRGCVKIHSFAESPALFSHGMSFFISNHSTTGKWYKLLKATPHKKGLIALFDGVNRESAEVLVGSVIAISKSDLPHLEEDTYYWQDLTGLKVTDIKLGHIGIIDYIFSTGSNDVFVVKGQNKEILVPALSWIVVAVDFDEQTMTVDLPDGLTE